MSGWLDVCAPWHLGHAFAHASVNWWNRYTESVQNQNRAYVQWPLLKEKTECFLPIISHSTVCQTACQAAFRRVINANAVPIKLAQRTAPVSLESQQQERAQPKRHFSSSPSHEGLPAFSSFLGINLHFFSRMMTFLSSEYFYQLATYARYWAPISRIPLKGFCFGSPLPFPFFPICLLSSLHIVLQFTVVWFCLFACLFYAVNNCPKLFCWGKGISFKAREAVPHVFTAQH